MNITIYIRKENEAAWNDIPDKSAWVNAQIAKGPRHQEAIDRNPEKPVWPGTVVRSNEPLPGQIDLVEVLSEEKPCCKMAKPCVHWSFDGANEKWVNALSGRERVVA